MGSYKYKAVDATGKVVSGEATSEHRSAVVADLRKQGMTLLHLEEEGDAPLPDKDWKSLFSFEFAGVSSQAVAFFTRQLAELTDAGLPILQSLDSLKRLSPSVRFRAVIESISASIQSGRGLYESFAEHPEVFSPIYLNMLKVAEASGELSKMLNRLADYLEFELEVRSKLKGALTYPVFVLIFSVLLVWAMVAFLLPGFVPLWESAKLDLSAYPITMGLMQLSKLTKTPLDDVLVIGFVGLVYYAFRKLLENSEAQKARDSFIFHLPVLSGIVRLGLMTRVATTLSTLLNVGLPLPRALQLVSETAGNAVMGGALLKVSQSVQQGEDIGKAFAATGVFPPLAVQMLGIGERTGDIASTFERLGRYYQAQLETAIRAFSSLVEPLTMVLIGGVVFLFVLGVFLPIMGVVAAMQAHM